MDLLKDAVKKAMEQKPGAVIVVSTCVAGIIGDDLKAVEEMSTDDIPVIAITADGDMNGDYMEGLRMAQEIIVSRLADRKVPKEDKCVNIIGEAGIVTNKGSNFAVMERLLSGMGIRVNCRFLGDATAQEVIQDELLSPNSAVFPKFEPEFVTQRTKTVVYEGVEYNVYTVTAYVDSDNAFGTSIRSSFVVEIGFPTERDDGVYYYNIVSLG